MADANVLIVAVAEIDCACARALLPESVSVECVRLAHLPARELSRRETIAVVVVPPAGAAAEALTALSRLAAEGIPAIAVVPEGSAAGEALAAVEAGACQVLSQPADRDGMTLALAQGEQWRRLWRQRAAAAQQEQRADRVYQETLKALGSALDTRDPETQEHATRVVTNALRLGKALKLSRHALVALERGAVLHDVGKIGVPDGILMKPARLSTAEWHCMRSHAEIGYDMLASISFLTDALPIIHYHHENYDGSGYPEGLSGEDIPLGARLFAIVDALDAMTSDRPYRRAMPLQEAVAEITRCAGTQFDPAIVAALVRLVDSGEWPHDGQAANTGH
ncbi:MAG: two-component system response regulator [Armatimonadetes bacterium CG_4_10_14_3_um_filter_66_18]|nr:HD domain-containing protein [Armatimonadota bacterium]OIO93425.1 MAG: hypothetical protein AUJ96_30265 [Armatimonadetes bacterium CG2_30_66_41]PIU88079.1 MAG: two-component system response regulator [Armatimonadetes bacterium CG06_land_8_20_14_3_00_66_21]PIX44947.1 MAG: two-component system response regulator [Armatimonadetes bacterium CG_4_8_14_3_um_filter_66_20]PIY36639.1 MAG: two-component system response regulator [Armatimonadetes bacterium CG_4_10_14_3_um_filter_66_18]PIZ49015.1 MAG: 